MPKPPAAGAGRCSVTSAKSPTRAADKARQVLGGEKVFVRRQLAPEAVAIRDDERPEQDPELFEQLRRKRREFADQAGVPAYIIFSDSALVEMATHRPRTKDLFLAINRVGQARPASFGEGCLHSLQEVRD